MIEAIAAIALWCGFPVTNNADMIRVKIVQACRERMMKCVFEERKSNITCFKNQELGK